MDEHIGMATAGLLADGKHLGGRAREEASSFRENYNDPITVQVSYEGWRGDIVCVRFGYGWEFRFIG